MRVQLLCEIEEEITQLLSRLIRINTTNPPGNETEAAKYLAEYLSKEGFKCELFESAPGRGSIITRIKGTGEKPSLLLLSHLDVVAANADEWSVDPFGGVVKDGYVWGRGAYDMKGMTAIEVLVMELLKKNKVPLKGDVVLAATADEEQGGLGGAGYLVRNHREKILADYVLNEGGGLAIPVRGKNVYTVATAEKGILWFRVKAKGTSGHGSMPDVADNAIMRINKVVQKLGQYRAKVMFVPTVKHYLNALAREDASLKQPFARLIANPELSHEVLDELAGEAKPLADDIRPRIRMTIAPTMIHGGVRENMIPSECEAVFDCRVLPGQDVAETFQLIKELLADVGLDQLVFEIIQQNGPSESPVETPLYNVIAEVLREFEPNCGVTPLLMTGGTDLRFFRRLGSTCYGFQPVRYETPYDDVEKGMHGVDERISVRNLVFGASVLYEVVKNFMS